MASAYGPWVATDDWRSWVEIKQTSETDTTATISISGWFQADAGSSTANGNVKGYLGYKIGSGNDVWNASSGHGANIDPFSSGSSKYFLTTTFKSVTVNKTHSAQTVKGYAEVDGEGGLYSGMTSKATASITVAAKSSYAVTYNANGGSGAPAAQTKWHGENLALSSTKPTRANYDFLGWSTSSTATSATYAAGASYTGNAALTLYAVWKVSAASPSITKLVAYRSDSEGNRVDSSDSATTHVTVEYGWSVDSGTSSRKIQVSLGGTAQTAITLSANSGTGTVTYAKSLATNTTLQVSATLTDVTHDLRAVKSTVVPTMFRPFTMANGGKAAAFFGMAVATWDRILKIFGRLDIDGRVVNYVEGAKGDAGIRFFKQATGASQWNPVMCIQTKGGGSWTFGNYDGEELRFVYFNSTNIANSTNTATLNVALGTTKKSWHKAISGWTTIATTTGTTAKTFSDLKTAGYSEVLVVGTYTTSASYGGSVLIPIDQLSTTERDWYLGGGHWSAGWGAACKLSTTKMTPYQVRYNGNNGNGTWTLYAR